MAEKSYLRAVTKSLAGAVPFVSDETRDAVDKKLARVLLGLQGQVAGLDEAGKPNNMAWLDVVDRMKESDEASVPGVMNEVLSLPTLMPGLADAGVLIGSKFLPGVDPLTAEQIAWLEAHVPERSKKAAARQEKLTKLLRQRAALEKPKGFEEHALESLGSMLGQIPLGGIGKTAAESAAKKSAKAAVGAVPEYLLPTIKPSAVNYASGTAAGGALGALGDEPDGYAEGGKVSAITKALEELSKMLQGLKPNSESIDEMLFGLKKVEGVAPQKREDLTKLVGLRNSAMEHAELGPLTDKYNQRLFDSLAEIYMSPSVSPLIPNAPSYQLPMFKGRGGKVGQFHSALTSLEKGLDLVKEQ